MVFGDRKWALVLSGGGAKGIAHIGVLKYFDEIGVRPDLIAGTSVGAIIGGFYACGMSAKEIEDFIINEFDYKDYFDIRTLHLPDMPFAKAIQLGETIKNLFSRPGVDSGEKIYQKLLEFTKNKKFGEEKIPFYCNSVDIVNHSHVVHDSGKIADAIRASMAVPGFFAPYKVENKFLVDGGVYDNMPVFIPREKGIKRVVAVNLNNYNPIDMTKIETGVDVIIEAMFIVSRIRKRIGKDLPDIEIIANDGRANNNFSNPQGLIDLGYLKTVEKNEEIQKLIYSPIKRFLKMDLI